MQAKLSDEIVVAAVGFGWPEGDHGSKATELPQLTFELVANDTAPFSLSIAKIVSMGDRVLNSAVAWTGTYDSKEELLLRHDWLASHGEELAFLGRVCIIAGSAAIDPFIELGAAAEAARREQAKRQAEKEAEQAQRRARIEQQLFETIEVTYITRNKQFGLELQRASERRPFWTILFRERWERERFWDWLRWQRHRFEDLATFLETRASIDLDRELLKEMLTTERRVKEEGLGAGGRRPLRFWRGDRQ